MHSVFPERKQVVFYNNSYKPYFLLLAMTTREELRKRLEDKARPFWQEFNSYIEASVLEIMLKEVIVLVKNMIE